MNVVQINTYSSFGGAARAAHRLHSELLREGVGSSMLVENLDTPEPAVVQFAPPTDLVSRIRRRLRWDRIRREFRPYEAGRPAGSEVFTDDRGRYVTDLLAQLPSCDIANLHWVSRFVDYRSFFLSVPQRIPVVWTLHDMNAFTGGCHYDSGCRRFADRCGACPQLGSQDSDDLSHRILERKIDVFERVPRNRLHFVTPSRWLEEEVRKSHLGRMFAVSTIPNGLDLDVFAPRDRRAARDVLGVPAEATILLFMAHDLQSERKGHRLLTEALERVDGDRENLFLLWMGRGEPPADGRIPGKHLRHLDNDRMLSLVYSAADLYVIASRQDNLPNTVMEAMACGVPVVGFEIGGIPDMVRHGVNGLLAPPFDVGAFGARIMELVHDPARRAEMAANCRRISEQEFSLDLQARRYMALYQKLVAA
jgi:glycosyltransferase involved in cell wall biosynthesis